MSMSGLERTTVPDGARATDGRAEVIVRVEHVTKEFATPGAKPLSVLDDISFELREGEIVALLGKSGSGKSTLLRCIAGLIAPTTGVVSYRGTPLNGANPGVAMVFQTFALLPWLTVQANVEMGLEALGIPPAERRARAERAIDLIGLDGFESAYPKELSGGMRQRVGFARAFVVNPDALLMDEPFSALDVLTSENLRTELLNLWSGQSRMEFPTKAILIVTHNIEEAVQMADRILVLSSNPGRFKAHIENTLSRPRDRRSPEFEALVDRIYGIMTERTTASAVQPATLDEPGVASPTEVPLPDASVGGLAGLMEILVNRGGRDDLPELAQLLTFEVDDLLPIVDAAEMLGFADVHDADIEVTPAGKEWVAADILTSKELFAERASERAPLVRAIVRALETTKDGTLNERFFRDLLRRGFSQEEVRAQLDTAIGWGRYGELFDYDADTGELALTTSGPGALPAAPVGPGATSGPAPRWDKRAVPRGDSR
jgi:NitT/TauT family transport system ATP-binding protein